jgi:hypothetical protein
VAECRIESVAASECIAFNPHTAPVATPDWWGGQQMNVTGIRIREEIAVRFREAIAAAN